MSRAILLGACLWVFAAPLARAHPLAPASLVLRAGEGQRATLQLRATPAAFPLLRAEVPEGCQAQGAPREGEDGEARTVERTLRCAELPTAERLRLSGLERAGIDAVARVERADGGVEHALLSAGPQLTALVEAPPGAGPFLRYLQLGFEHLWVGADHILFLLCLLLIAPGARAGVWALSAFTVGHALTLTLSALDLVRLPAVTAEVLIAASLVWMAGSVLLEGRQGRFLVAAGAGFGLVHGLGFAGVLREVGLPPGDISTSLLAFNLGIEVGQLSLALLAWAGFSWVRRRGAPGRWEMATAYAVASVTGVMGAFWMLDRLV